MRKAFLVLFGLFFVSTIIALNPAPSKGISSGKDSIVHVYMFERDASDLGHRILDDGASGKLSVDTLSERFTLVARGLNPSQEYVLLKLPPGPWKLYLVGQGRTNKAGNLNIRGHIQNVAGNYWLAPASNVEGEIDGTLTDDQADMLVDYDLQEFLFGYAPIDTPPFRK